MQVQYTCSSRRFSQPFDAGVLSSVAPGTSLQDPDIKMHCFICVTYMIILTSANPITTREIATKHEKRSLFRDVIESLRIRSQLPEEINQHDDNNLSHSYDRYGYENEPLQLPSDADFIPRRNDRIEMPPLKYRFPKSLELNDTNKKSNEPPKEEIVLYIDTHESTPAPKPTTQKPQKKRPTTTKNKQNKNKESEDTQSTEYKPLVYNMSGLSHIGDRESQTVVKPTVIVNIRGSVNHHDSEIRLEKNSLNDTLDIPPRNVFNINQEINLDREFGKVNPEKIKQNIKIAARENVKVEEDMMMCETNKNVNRKQMEEQNRKFDNVLQILFSL